MKRYLLAGAVLLAVLLARDSEAQGCFGPGCGGSSSGSSTITNGVTATSGCVAGGVLRSISNLVECGAGLTFDGNIMTVGSVTTAGRSTIKFQDTISGSSATSNFLNITGTLTASPSAVQYGTLASLTAQASGHTLYGSGVLFTSASAAISNGNAAFVAGNTVVNSSGVGDLFQGFNFGGGSVGVSAYSTGSDNTSHAAFRGYSTNSGGTATHYGAALIAAGVGAINVGSAGQASTGATVNIGSAGWLGTAAPTLISAAGFFSNGSAALPIFVGRDGNTTVFDIADGGAVTIAPNAAVVPLTLNNGANAVSPLVVQDNGSTVIEVVDSAVNPSTIAGGTNITIRASASSANSGQMSLNGGGSGDVVINSFGPRQVLTLDYSEASTSATNSAFSLALDPGATSNGFGNGLVLRGQSSTAVSQDMIRVAGVWTDATHASRSSALVFDVVNGAAALAEVGRFNPVGGLKIATGTKPTCDSTYRGTLYYVAGGAGVADTYEVCKKDAGDSYAWASIF